MRKERESYPTQIANYDPLQKQVRHKRMEFYFFLEVFEQDYTRGLLTDRLDGQTKTFANLWYLSELKAHSFKRMFPKKFS